MIEAIAGNRKIARKVVVVVHFAGIDDRFFFNADEGRCEDSLAAYETIARGEDILRL